MSRMNGTLDGLVRGIKPRTFRILNVPSSDGLGASSGAAFGDDAGGSDCRLDWSVGVEDDAGDAEPLGTVGGRA